MLEARVKQLKKQAVEKEAAKVAKEAAKEAAEKEAVEKEAVRKEAAEKEEVEKEAADKEAAKEATEKEDDDKEDQFFPSGSSDNDGPVGLHRVKSWFKCPIYFNHLYQFKNSLLFHIQYMMMDEFLLPNVVKQHDAFWSKQTG
jgi:hypothetical protein